MINVSIIVPVRNGEAFLYKSIKNLIHCTSYSDEIIYVDDNSTDQSLKILKEMQKLHRRIIIKRNPGMGLVDALNHGVDSSTNDWIARFDVDDEYPEDRLKEQKRFINLNVVAIFCDYEFRGANDEYLGKVPSPVFDEAIKVSFQRSQRTPHPGALFSKESFYKVGGYLKSDFPVEDLSLWVRMSREGKIISVPKSLLYYRLHSNSVTAKKRESIENKKNLILKKYLYFESIEVNLNHLEIWNRYKLVPEPHLRQLLFIFDYLNFLKLKNENQKYVKIILTYFLRVIFCPIKLYYVYRLLKEKSLRNNYRLNYK